MPTAPGPTSWIPLPIGEFGRFVRDPAGFQINLRERFGDIARFRIGPLVVHFFFHPDHVRRVLHDQQKNYLRGWQFRLLSQLVGTSLLVFEGDEWIVRRRLAQPAFHRQRLATYAAAMVDATWQMIDRWRAAAQSTIDVGPEMARLTLQIASRTFFDRDVSDQAGTITASFLEMAGYLERRFNRMFTTPPAWIPTPANRRFKAAVGTLNELVLGLIHERRRDNRDHGDLLSMLMQARDDETGQTLTDDQIRGEVLTYLIAGHETTATALTWTWHLLSLHRETQQRVREEITAVIGDRRPSVDDVPKLILTRAAIEESMRLFPPVWAIPRQALAADVVGGFDIPRGSTVVVSPFVTHRHPDHWPEPDRFDIDRFTPAQTAARPKGMYFPFLSGPHQCIGNEFAMLEMILVVAAVLQRFEFSSPTGRAIQPVGSIALRPREQVVVQIRA